tara:strand:+ start:291 stop:641 length:351 start_codon:yes stop_codon:yes gene_type:complete
MKDYIKLVLELREWVSKKTGNSGETYCFNNSSANSIDCFGFKASLSISKSGETFNQDSYSIFMWLNDMDADSYNVFVEEYGTEIYIHVPTQKLLTQAQYDELGVDSTVSEQPSASF